MNSPLAPWEGVDHSPWLTPVTLQLTSVACTQQLCLCVFQKTHYNIANFRAATYTFIQRHRSGSSDPRVDRRGTGVGELLLALGAAA